MGVRGFIQTVLNHLTNGIFISTIFWGLWLLPFGYLVYKSRVLPKVLGVLLMAGCFGYVVNFMGQFFIDNYQEFGISDIASKPGQLGEVGICLYLLIAGIKASNKRD